MLHTRLPFLHPILGDPSARPSIHARQLPGGMSDPMLSAGLNSAGRAILFNIMVSLSRMDVCTALSGPMSIGHARRCHQYGRSGRYRRSVPSSLLPPKPCWREIPIRPAGGKVFVVQCTALINLPCLDQPWSPHYPNPPD